MTIATPADVTVFRRRRRHRRHHIITPAERRRALTRRVAYNILLCNEISENQFVGRRAGGWLRYIIINEISCLNNVLLLIPNSIVIA